MISGAPMKKWRSENNPVEECRSMVQVLGRKIEQLKETGRADQDQVTCISAMISRLNTLEALLNRFDQGPKTAPATEMMEDAFGFTYRSVRSCDLERISDK